MRPGRAFAAAAVVLALLVLAGVLGVHWASRSEPVLRWAIAQIAQRLPGTLSVTGVHGALDRPIRIDTLEYVAGSTRIIARGIDLDWSAAALIGQRTLHVDSLRIARLEILARPTGTRPIVPAQLRAPLPVRIDALTVDRLRFDNGRTPFDLSGIALSYAASPVQHTLELQRLDSPWGQGEGRLALGSDRPFALEGVVRWRAAAPSAWPVRAEFTLGGTLEQVRLQGALTVRDQRVPVQAHLAPFTDSPLVQADMRTAGLDLSDWFEQLPRTRIDATVTLAGTPLPTTPLPATPLPATPVRGTLRLVNAEPGSLDADRLPLATLDAQVGFGEGVLRLDALRAALGEAGSASGSVTLGAQAIDARLQVGELNLRGVHAILHRTALRGTIALSRRGSRDEFALDVGEGALRLSARAGIEGSRLTVHDALLRAGQGSAQAQGTLGLDGAHAFALSARLERLNPADFGAFPRARVNGTARIEGNLKPRWEARARYVLQDSAWRGYRLSGNGRLALSPQRARDVDARLTLGRNTLQAQGAYGAPGDVLRFSLSAPALTALGGEWRGTLEARGVLAGTPARPAGEVKLSAREVGLPGGLGFAELDADAGIDAGADPRLRLHASATGVQVSGTALEAARLSVDGTRGAHTIALNTRSGALDLRGTARGGLDERWDRWLGRIEALENAGSEALRLEQPAALSVSRAGLALGAAQLQWAGGRIVLEDTLYAGGRIRSSGTLTGLPMRKLLALTGTELGWDNDILLGARWRVDAAEQVDGQVEIFQEAGDIVARSDDQALPLGVQKLALDVTIARNRVVGNAVLDSATAGTATATGQTVLSRRAGRWGLAGTSPAVLDVQARLDSVRPLAAALTRDVVVDGNARMRLTVRGTIAEPDLRGSLTATSIQVEQVATGVFLHDGSLQADFTPGALRLRSLQIRAGDGEFTGSGEYFFDSQRLALKWTARELATVQMPDLLLVISGNGTVSVADGQIALSGAVRADKGRVELRDTGGAVLGDDVVVVGRERKPSIAGRLLRSRIDMQLDLGSDFAVSGRGLQARLGGRLRVHNAVGTALRADGEIKVINGTYEAYGRTLQIEGGTLLFAGAPDNPALDIMALRKNQRVHAGVHVTGTARRPEVRLVSVPEVPDMEKLAWLTLGRPIQSGNQADTESLQRYAAAMAASLGTGNFQAQVARAVGLDEIVVMPGTDPSSEGGIIQVGKRIGDRIYVVLEQRLSTAQNVLRVNYQLARDWSLRLESGETDAVDVFYSLSFD